MAPENLKLRRRLELPTAIDQQPTYCQDVNGKCWSNQDFQDKCAAYPGTLCLVGTDWSNGANSCGVPLDVVYFVDDHFEMAYHETNIESETDLGMDIYVNK